MSSANETIARADELSADGQSRAAIELLRQANRHAPNATFERRLAQLRYQAFGELDRRQGFERWPVPVDNLDRSGPAHIPEVTREELDAETLRRSILEHGSLRVGNLLDDEQVGGFVEGIEAALALRDTVPDAHKRRDQAFYAPLRIPREEAKTLERQWVAGSGGVLACDSPKLLNDLFETYDTVGLRAVLAEYLGETPVLSANKCTLRRVPLTANTEWHQDGSFLGRGIRALNVWLALSDCGVDSPGIDLVPRRFDDIVETGTGTAIFDWTVCPDVVARLAADAPVVRPEFRAGDALLFDDLFLHRTGLDPAMTRPRYAIEAWFFAPSVYPDGQVPLVW